MSGECTPIPKAPQKAAKKRKAVAKVRKTPASTLKRKCTDLHSLIVRAEGVCEAAGYPLMVGGKPEFCGARCTCPDFPREHVRGGCTLQCAHIVSRRYANTRTDEANALCLCARHHLHFTVHPVEWGQFVEGHIGRDAYAAIYRKAMAVGEKFDWEAEFGRLTARAVELGVKPGEGS